MYVQTSQSEYVFFSKCPGEITEPISPKWEQEKSKCMAGAFFPPKHSRGNQSLGKCKTVLKTTKRGGIRSKKNRTNKSSKLVKFSILGTNAAGLKAKKDSLKENVQLFNFPSVITIQETKFRKSANFKLENYQIFEKLRPGYGGGLLTAIDKSLNPVLIQPINEEIEILVVQCSIGKRNI